MTLDLDLIARRTRESGLCAPSTVLGLVERVRELEASRDATRDELAGAATAMLRWRSEWEGLTREQRRTLEDTALFLRAFLATSAVDAESPIPPRPW